MSDMPQTRFRPAGLSRRLVAPVLALVAVSMAGAAFAAGPSGLLRLSNGGTVTGEFRPSTDKGTFVWQGVDFTRPFEFVSGAISSVQFPSDPKATPVGQFGLELASGDTLFGNISRFDAEAVEIEVASIGRLSIKPASIRRMYRIDGNPSLLFHGPSGLSGWKASEEGAWQEDGPHLKTDKQGAMLTRDIKLPDEACIEFELAWEKTPAFTLSLGMNPDAPNDHRQHGFRFEVWDRDLVVVRENPQRADAAFIQTLAADVKHIHLTVYLSQSRGSMQVYSPGGKLEASIVVAPPEGAKKFGSGIRLINGAGDLRLEHLRVSRWNGSVLGAVAKGQTRVQSTEGKLIPGEFQGLDPASGEYIVKGEDGAESRIAPVAISMVDFSGGPNPEKRAVVTICQDGTRLSGTLEKIDEQHLVLSTPDAAAEVRVPLAKLRTVTVLPAGKPEFPEPPAGRAGRIELRGQRLPGRLVAGTNDGGASCLVWQPEGSRTASPVRASAGGRVVYRDPPPPVPQQQQAQARVEPQGNFAAIFLRNVSKGGAPKATTSKKAMTLHLVSGDMIPCTAMKIGEEGVTIETPLAKGQLVPHDQVKAVELLPGVAQPKLKTAKKDRLLTLPRLQKGSPPTHLLCSRTGDFLRCRLVELNDEKAVVEIQLENLDIPRDRIAQIIWFHPEDLEKELAATSAGAAGPSAEGAATPPKTPAVDPETPASQAPASTGGDVPAPAAAQPLRAQVLRRDGNRVTFFPEKVTETAISGRSSVLGECEFNLADADQVIFGQSIELAAAELPYHQWKLHPALEPLVAQDLGDGPAGAPTGQESLLVGKPAPDFELEMLSGGKFKLSECKGQIVVLDFWATWCGPCMQTMPLVEKAMEEFDSKQVRLVAVNLEEPAKNVRAVLDRHGFKVQVALDEDGVAARKYEANAIPQTVIIDREGKIHRLYVGGGPEMVEALSTTLKGLLGITAEKPETTTPATGS